jgi:hypothetical protein
MHGNGKTRSAAAADTEHLQSSKGGFALAKALLEIMSAQELATILA